MNLIDLTLKKPEENYHQYIWRMDDLIRSGTLPGWEKVAPYVNKQLFGDNESEYRTESAFRKPVKYVRDFVNAGVLKDYTEDEYLQELREQERRVEKARKKLSTEKIEYSKWLREEARDEMIVEKMCEAISTLPPLDLPGPIPIEENERAYLLTISDAHFGISFEIKDLFGNIINEYSPETFEKRMSDLSNNIISLVHKENIKVLNIWELGDGLQGILRLNSQLMKLRYGIIDSSILYANYLANWLNGLSHYVRINFQMVLDSNHNQIRLLGAPKNAFVEENMSKSMLVLIKERLKDNPNVTITENPTGMAYGNFCGYSCLGIHGEVKNLKEAVNGFSRAYDHPINYLIGGHMHHLTSEEVGIRSEALHVRSIIGVDPYGMSLNKASDAGASLYIFESEKGKICEYSIKLN